MKPHPLDSVGCLKTLHAQLLLFHVPRLCVEDFLYGKIRQKTAFGATDGMADIVTDRRPFGTNLANFGHGV